VNRRSASGFTLVEVLLVIAISAVILLAAYQAMSAASEGAQRTRQALQEINRLDRTWQIIAMDLRQALPPEAGPRGLRFEFAAGSLRTSGTDADQMLMIFSRRGWINPLERLRSDMQRVSYDIRDGVLWRSYLPELNLGPDDVDFAYQAQRQKLLEGVVDVQFRFLSVELLRSRGRSMLDGRGYSQDWEPVWPGPDQNPASPLPLAVEITIEIEGVGPSVRLFEIGR
jgi:general secretion pathway protein J